MDQHCHGAISPVTIPPLPRIAYNTACILSAIICIVAAILWPMSYFHSFTLWRITSDFDVWHVESSRGGIYLPLQLHPQHIPSEPGFSFSSGSADPDAVIEGIGSIEIERWQDIRIVDVFPSSRWHRREIVISHWLAALLTAILPAHRMWRRQRRRPAPGMCPQCGYDLRATLDRCPECGKAANSN